MSLAVFRSEVAECRAWIRRLDAGSPQTRAEAALPGWWEFGLPLVMPVYAGFVLATGSWDSEVGWWAAILPWWWLVAGGRLFAPGIPTEWESLRLPSRRAWIAARWSLRLPAHLWLGICTLLYALLLGLRETPRPESLCWTVALSLLLSPFLLTALVGWISVASRAFGGVSPLVPLIALSVAAAFFAGAGALLLYRRTSEALLASGLLAAFGSVILLLGLPSLRRLLHLPGGKPTLGRRLGRLGSLLVGLLPIAAVAAQAALIMGARFVVLRGETPRHWVFEVGPLILLVSGTVVAALHTLHLLPSIDLGAEPTLAETPARAASSGGAKRSPLLPVYPGGGLLRTAWSLYRGRWRLLQHPRLAFLPKLLWESRGIACGFIAVTATSVALGNGRALGTERFYGLLFLWMAWLFAMVVPSPLALPASRRLHLLGADYADLARHNLRWGLFLAVLPAALGGSVLLLLPWEGVPLEARTGGLLALTAFLAFRQGPAVPWLNKDSSTAGGKATLGFSAAWVVLWFLDAPLALLLGGAAAFLLALAAVARDLRDPEAAGRRFAGGAVDD